MKVSRVGVLGQWPGDLGDQSGLGCLLSFCCFLSCHTDLAVMERKIGKSENWWEGPCSVGKGLSCPWAPGGAEGRSDGHILDRAGLRPPAHRLPKS